MSEKAGCKTEVWALCQSALAVGSRSIRKIMLRLEA